MIQSLNSNRRILTLPAIHPCISIHPTTLLNSLIGLAVEINGYKSTNFPVHRKIIREVLREVGVLLVFFKDVLDRGSNLSSSVVLSLSEIHVVLQKLNHLICDCGRKGARVWILMNSERVVSEFRILVRSIAVTLDVIELDEIDAGRDVKEMVGLVARQAWSVAVALDAADDRMVKAVRRIVSQFESGIVPDASKLKRILDYLGVRNWVDCGDEIAFLEEEIVEHSTDSEGVLLGSLLGFMIYCRAVLLEVSGYVSKGERAKSSPLFQDTGLSSEGLMCPISLELMTNPVTISTGQTYDRPSIVRWLKAGYETCPVTGEKLTNTNLVPNTAVLNLIKQYCNQNNIPVAEQSNNRKREMAKVLPPQSSAAAGATRMTAAFLVEKLSTGSKEGRNRAAYEIRLLSKSSIFHRACLVEANSVPWLLHLLASLDPLTQDNAVAALLNLSKHPSGRTAIFEVGGLSLVVDVLIEGLKVEAQQNAAAILFYLSSVEEYRQEIGEIPEAIPALVNLLRKGTYRGKKNATVALYGLLLFPGHHSRILAAGVIPALNNLLTNEREELVNDCVGVLAKIAERQEGTNSILRSSSILPKLVDVLQSSTSRTTREHCVSLMLSLCNNGGTKAIHLLEKLPFLMPSLYSLITSGPPQASKKARLLINSIHQVYDQDCTASLTTSIQDHAVHAL